MWDSINGNLVSPSYGASSPYISFGIAPGMAAAGNVLPPIPFGGCGASYGQMGMGMGMYPMGMDTFTSQASVPPLRAHQGGESTLGTIGSVMTTVGKFALAGAALFLGYKGVKALTKASKPAAEAVTAKPSFWSKLKFWGKK